MTEDLKRRPSESEAETKEKKRLERELDEGLEDSFPASDPPTATQPTKSTPAKGKD